MAGGEPRPPDIQRLSRGKGHLGTHPYEDCELSDRSPGVNTHPGDVGFSPLLQQCFARGVHRERNTAIPATPPLHHVSAGHLPKADMAECSIPSPVTGLWARGLCQAVDSKEEVATGETQQHSPRTYTCQPPPRLLEREKASVAKRSCGIRSHKGDTGKNSKLFLQARRSKQEPQLQSHGMNHSC